MLIYIIGVKNIWEKFVGSPHEKQHEVGIKFKAF